MKFFSKGHIADECRHLVRSYNQSWCQIHHSARVLTGNLSDNLMILFEQMKLLRTTKPIWITILFSYLLFCFSEIASIYMPKRSEEHTSELQSRENIV